MLDLVLQPLWSAWSSLHNPIGKLTASLSGNRRFIAVIPLTILIAITITITITITMLDITIQIGCNRARAEYAPPFYILCIEVATPKKDPRALLKSFQLNLPQTIWFPRCLFQLNIRLSEIQCRWFYPISFTAWERINFASKLNFTTQPPRRPPKVERKPNLISLQPANMTGSLKMSAFAAKSFQNITKNAFFK